MSKPGELTADELVSIGIGIDGQNAHLNTVAGAWFKKLERELIDAFGFAPQYRHSGAYRTIAEQQAINPGQTVSDHLLGRAIDIRNYGTYIARDRALYREILDRNGFRNIQVNGRPFPSEPWHEVCTKKAAPIVPKPKPKPQPEEEPPVFVILKTPAYWQITGPGVKVRFKKANEFEAVMTVYAAAAAATGQKLPPIQTVGTWTADRVWAGAR